jgi:hypothetical protein
VADSIGLVDVLKVMSATRFAFLVSIATELSISAALFVYFGIGRVVKVTCLAASVVDMNGQSEIL